MQKTILITGASDGIGAATAENLASQGHTILLHGRNSEKLEQVQQRLSKLTDAGKIETYVADLSSLAETEELAIQIVDAHSTLDVLINNAGIYKTANPITSTGIDIRIMVNTLAPYLLTKRLLKLMNTNSRIINLSSAAQAPVALDALTGNAHLEDMEAYAQSKLAITMWTRELAQNLDKSPIMIALNPGSLLATKMVKEGFGVAGKDLSIGVEILSSLALSPDFDNSSGKYYDNDKGAFGSPHPDALDDVKCKEVVRVIEETLLHLSA